MTRSLLSDTCNVLERKKKKRQNKQHVSWYINIPYQIWCRKRKLTNKLVSVQPQISFLSLSAKDSRRKSKIDLQHSRHGVIKWLTVTAHNFPWTINKYLTLHTWWCVWSIIDKVCMHNSYVLSQGKDLVSGYFGRDKQKFWLWSGAFAETSTTLPKPAFSLFFLLPCLKVTESFPPCSKRASISAGTDISLPYIHTYLDDRLLLLLLLQHGGKESELRSRD